MMSRQAGLSLLELMITLSVIAVLLTIGISFANSFQKQAEMDQTLAEMKALTLLAEQSRLIPGGDNFVRTQSHIVANFVDLNGGNVAGVSTTAPALSPEGRPYLLTTSRRLGVVEVDVSGTGLNPYGVGARNIAGGTRLTAGYKPNKLRHFSAQAYWDKKVLFCEGYTPATLPAHCG